MSTFGFVALLSLFAGASACDGVSRLEGRIRDAGGQPIAGVNVVLTVEGKRDSETQSRDDGTYVIQSLAHAPSSDVSLTITAEKPGYIAYERRLTSGEADENHSLDIVLVPVHMVPPVKRPSDPFAPPPN